MDGGVVMRAVPWFSPRAYLNPAVILGTIVVGGFSAVWFWTPVNNEVPWWALIVVFVLWIYWPIDRAVTQARAHGALPIVIRDGSSEVEILGERLPKRSIHAIEYVQIRYGKTGGEGGPIVYQEIHAIVEGDGEYRRVVIVEEGMNSAKIAKGLAAMVGCPIRTAEALGSED